MAYQPFSNWNDLDRQILYNIPFNDLKSLITVSKYVSDLITEDNYWPNRIKYLGDRFTMSPRVRKQHDEIISWMDNRKEIKVYPINSDLISYGNLEILISNKRIFRCSAVDSAQAGLDGKNDVMHWIINIFLTCPNFDRIIRHGRLDLVRLLCEKYQFHKRIDPNLAILYNQKNILNYIYSIFNYPSIDLNIAAERGFLELLKKVPDKTVNHFVFRDDVIDRTIVNGHYDTAEWLLERYVPIGTETFIHLIKYNQINLIRKILSDIRFYPIYFTRAVELGKIDIVTLFLQQNKKPSDGDFDIIIKNGDLTLLRLFTRFMIYPKQSHADLAVNEEQFKILEWMEIGGILPSIDAFNKICVSNKSYSKEMHKWLLDRHFYPSTDSVNEALRNGNYNILSTLREYQICPNLEGIQSLVVSPERNSFTYLFHNIPKDKVADFSKQFHQLLLDHQAIY